MTSQEKRGFGAASLGAAVTTPALMERLARMLLQPGRPLAVLDERNTVKEWVHLEAALADGVAFFGRVREDVLAVDFDRQNGAAAAERIYWRARMMGLPALLLASGQDDRRHCFVHPVDAQQKGALARAAKGEGADVRVDIRPPLAPHRLFRHGVRPRILRGSSLLLEFDKTGALPSGRWGELVREAALHGGGVYPSRSEMLAACALAAVNAGWEFEEFHHLVRADGPAIANAYRGRAEDRGDQSTARWLHDQVWASAIDHARRQPAHRQVVPVEIRLLAGAVATLQWQPRGGPTQRAVYLALINIAVKAGSRTFFASIRTIQQAAGIPSRSTVERAIKALERRDLLEWASLPGQSSSGRTGRARWTSRWRLPMRHIESAEVDRAAEESFRAAAATVGHDAFYNRTGLGKAAHRALTTLSSSPGTAAELAARLGVAPRTAQTYLRALAQSGLVEQGTDRHWRPVERDLDTVAADLGNVGRGQRLRQGIQLERQGYDANR